MGFARSPHRLPDPDSPILIVHDKETDCLHERYSFHFQKKIFDLYDKEFFFENLFPESINDIYGKPVFQDHLSNDLEITLNEILKGKKNFTYCTVLQKKNFNFRKKCGLLILKHKRYPLVIKFFLESAQSLIEPGWKGFEPNFIFFLSGGIGRQLAGFTRVKNRHYIENILRNSDEWGSRVILPRKWFWIPKKNYSIKITGKKISQKDFLETEIPGIYAVIADFCPHQDDPRYSEIRDSEVMKLCNFLNMYVDPHENNFIVTHSDKEGLVITIIDTEHFPSMVGLENQITFNNHAEWFGFLAFKCLKDAYFRTKKMRKEIQRIHKEDLFSMSIT